MTVSDMGAANSVLLIGAYASKVAWTNINNSSYTYASYVAANRLVPFSSRGPMVDGRIKPDITAPGVTIATSMSSYDTAYSPTGTSQSNIRSGYTSPVTGRTYYYGEFTGTSAASPAAAGIVALMLQVNPSLTPQQAKDVIFQTAIQDAYTGTLPAAGNNGWGHGKINAYGAVRKLVQDLGVYQYTGKKLDCVLFPNPNSGSFMLDYTGTKPDQLLVEIVDITGRIAAQSQWSVAAGSNQRSLDFSSLAKGTYMVTVTGKEGKVSIKTVIR
jgi:subtilisin family serine protease